jgi:type I restriction enzyme S subunit
VLDLAVRGKLVPQDPNDEPASDLLKRIAAEKARLLRVGEFQEPRSFVRIDRNDLPFVSPPLWAWVRLIEIARPSYGFAFPSTQFNSARRGKPLIRIRDISNIDTEAYFEGDYDPAYLVVAGDYLVGMDGDFNLRRWQGKDGLLNQRIMRINGWRCGVNPEFVKLPLQFILDYLHGETSLTTVKHLSAKQVNGIEIPLPPLAEQHRIVAKVDELMVLCDRLQAARSEREETRDRLTGAILARLKALDPDTFDDGARFALDAMPALTSRADQIKQLRQTILNLAVRGKLVPQDKAEERENQTMLRRDIDAEEYDQRAFEERAALFRLPQTWTIEPLSRVSENIVDCPHTTPSWTTAGVLCIKTNQVRAGTLDLTSPNFVTEATYQERIERLEPRCDDILYIREGGVRGVGCRIPANTRLCLGQRLMLIRANKSVSPAFLELCVNSPWITDFAEEKTTGGAAPRVNMSVVRAYPIPIPPISEQHRIIARIGELMALCDRLEASLTTAGETRRRLLEALLAEALALDDERELEAAE